MRCEISEKVKSNTLCSLAVYVTFNDWFLAIVEDCVMHPACMKVTVYLLLVAASQIAFLSLLTCFADLHLRIPAKLPVLASAKTHKWSKEE